MTTEMYWEGWYSWMSVAAVVGYVIVTAGVVTGLAIYQWWKRE